MWFKFSLAVCLFLISDGVGSTDYCSKDLCPPMNKHIACENYGDFDESCGPGVAIVQLSMRLRAQLLFSLNTFRNGIALGRYPPFRPAARMATLRWSEELAGLARFALRSCDNLQEYCSNTNDFKYVSYIYGGTRWLFHEKTPESVLQYVIKFWINDHKNCSTDHINAKRPLKDGKCRGYFTQLVQDQADHIGCALIQRHGGGGSQHFYALLCQFSRGKIASQRVYAEGKLPGERCLSGTHATYQGLCSPEEHVNANALELVTLN